MEQLHFITKLLDIKDPNIQILDIINKDTHKEIIAKLDYDAPSCPECGNQLKKYDFQKPPTRILLRKRRFKCYHCSKMMVAETSDDVQSYFFSFYYITVLNLALLDSPLLSIYSEKRRKNLRIISGLVIKFFSQYRKVEKVVVFHEYVR
ncbi:transposase-like protein [Streptococcus pneumoniae]|nr:transposase-like protein [Streptococcus pneumoniae]COM54824.1 transposase-like protein [Streptococcus pneumoniae]COQ27153.1 transposase-like protein [Streptococcus pneumoniae]